MVTRANSSSYPVIILDKRIINESVVVLLGYIILGIIIAIDNHTILQVGLAVLLAVFGSGTSIVALLFPRSYNLDFVERAALSACLSMAVGGLLAFALAWSTWGLHVWSFLITSGLFSLICYMLILYRRRNFSDDEALIHLDSEKLFTRWHTQQSMYSRCVTAILFMFLFAGAWVLFQNLTQSSLDPTMTEFFLLGQDGQTDKYPKNGFPGEILNISYGIINRENLPMSYQVKAYIQGKEVGTAKLVNLNPDETHIDQINFQLMKTLSNQTKVEFLLFREDKRYRSLHLWIDIVNSTGAAK